jgi:hypothetical protein
MSKRTAEELQEDEASPPAEKKVKSETEETTTYIVEEDAHGELYLTTEEELQASKAAAPPPPPPAKSEETETGRTLILEKEDDEGEVYVLWCFVDGNRVVDGREEPRPLMEFEIDPSQAEELKRKIAVVAPVFGLHMCLLPFSAPGIPRKDLALTGEGKSFTGEFAPVDLRMVDNLMKHWQWHSVNDTGSYPLSFDATDRSHLLIYADYYSMSATCTFDRFIQKAVYLRNRHTSVSVAEDAAEADSWLSQYTVWGKETAHEEGTWVSKAPRPVAVFHGEDMAVSFSDLLRYHAERVYCAYTRTAPAMEPSSKHRKISAWIFTVARRDYDPATDMPIPSHEEEEKEKTRKYRRLCKYTREEWLNPTAHATEVIDWIMRDHPDGFCKREWTWYLEQFNRHLMNRLRRASLYSQEDAPLREWKM